VTRWPSVPETRIFGGWNRSSAFRSREMPNFDGKMPKFDQAVQATDRTGRLEQRDLSHGSHRSARPCLFVLFVATNSLSAFIRRGAMRWRDARTPKQVQRGFSWDCGQVARARFFRRYPNTNNLKTWKPGNLETCLLEPDSWLVVRRVDLCTPRDGIRLLVFRQCLGHHVDRRLAGELVPHLLDHFLALLLAAVGLLLLGGGLAAAAVARVLCVAGI
jgi:hypothetical protein